MPEAATWGGGVDGGDWFLCSARSESPTRFDCTIYDDFSGGVTARGTFELRECTLTGEAQECERTGGAARYTTPAVVPIPLRYRIFDGSRIKLDGPYLLLADGKLDFPFEPGWGTRGRFSLGEELGPVVEYGTPPYTKR